MTKPALTPGQARAVEALIGAGYARTYPEAAAAAGVSLGTLHTHLRRLRERNPELYADVMALRGRLLAIRHAEAQARAKAHSDAWFRKERSRAYYARFGCWPWERRR